jgi:glycerol-3-phosphate dehydrogenase
MQRNLDALTDDPLDLLILGGGITGAGVALDAALRGLRVGLIDKGDFASGTSSVSSKLVHGGLRYLEHAEFHLVYEALHERGLLLHNAPHLVRPLRFIIPFYRGSRVAPWKWRAGLTVYDLLAGRHNIRRSRPLELSEVRGEFPTLQDTSLLGGADYYDAQMDDARLCIEVLRTAALQGARVANYVEAVAFESGGIRVVDRISGKEWVLRARQVLNAAGPWVDAVGRLAGDMSGPNLRPTKGVHLVVRDLGLSSAFLLLHPEDGRVFFVIPWLGKTLLGTTDSFTDEAADGLTVTDADVHYLLAGYGRYFSPVLETRDVLGSFVGLRPLIRAKAGDPAGLSREFRLWRSPSGLLNIAGGKYTTYRRMAEVVTDAVIRGLGQPRRSGRTREFRLDGAAGPALHAPPSAAAKYLSEGAWQHLLARYGRRAYDVAAILDEDPSLARPVVEGESDLRAEFVYQRRHEMALMADDFLLRRTRLGLFHPRLRGLSVSELLGQELPGTRPRAAAPTVP